MQSSWYHPILQSNPQERVAPWQTRKAHIKEAETWIATHSNTVPQAVYYLLQSETLHGILVLLCPSGDFSQLDIEGRELLIANAFKYARITKELCNSKNFNLSTCLDCHRSNFVGTQLLRLWRDDSGELSKNQRESLVAALSGIDYIQDRLALRFGSSTKYRRYKLESARVLQPILTAF